MTIDKANRNSRKEEPEGSKNGTLGLIVSRETGGEPMEGGESGAGGEDKKRG